MTISVLSIQKILLLIPFTIAMLCCHTGDAQGVSGQIVSRALLCFSNKIYAGCDEAYRLTQSGNLNVPPEATDLFCNGPCLEKTRSVLNCINGLISNFIFYNKATVKDIDYALNAGCSFTSQRGDFNVARYFNDETSSAHSLAKLIGFYALAAVITCSYILMF